MIFNNHQNAPILDFFFFKINFSEKYTLNFSAITPVSSLYTFFKTHNSENYSMETSQIIIIKNKNSMKTSYKI